MKLGTSRLLAGLLCVLGCESAHQEEAEQPAQGQALQKKPGVTILNDPGGLYFAEVTAAGTGCPEGSWLSSVSADGQVFTTMFSAYMLELSPEQANITKDCTLTMKLHSDAERSFAVISVFYNGYMYLEKGVSGRQTVRYGFHGSSADAGNSRTDFAGPTDKDFLITDDVGVDKQKWSPCGTDHTLTATTELRLQNGTPRASGYVNMAAADGSIRLDLKLGVRTCAKQPPGKADAGAGRPNGR